MKRTSLILIVIATLITGGIVGLQFESEKPITAAITDNNTVLSNSVGSTSLNYRLIDPDNFPVQKDEYDRPLPATEGENILVNDKAFKHEILTINLALESSVEYKAEMDQRDGIVYSWTVNEGEVYFDFHGHPRNEETGFFTRYLEGEGSQNSGSIVAPYKGEHGWFFLNISHHPITIKLEVSGFYNELELVQE
jgi:hypothetical protein